MSGRWRLTTLAGAAAGLLLSPAFGAPPLPALGLAVAAVAGLLFLGRGSPGSARVCATLSLVAIGVAAALIGAVAGAARLQAIDSGAFRGQPGGRVDIRGFVTAVPRRADGRVSVPVQTADGRLLVDAPEPVPELPVGAEIGASGRIGLPEPWLRPQLQIRGIARIVAAASIELTGSRRGGIDGALDTIRTRAEAALIRGMPPAEADLARGFVLGQDDRIAAATISDFQRSGLAHLLAVSGQNVMLLTVLALAVLALAGTSLRARLLWVLLLIAIYVPVAGGGASIQRAGVMGAAAIAASLASRPRSRAHVLLLAVWATLLLNPRASAEIGWQLSFAAVVGIAVWARPLAAGARSVLGAVGNRARIDWRRGLADGFGVTSAATLATTPLLALHFEVFSIAALPANLLALPAVAPVMWLGMLTAFLGQISPLLPVEWLNAVNAGLIAYIEQVAHWLAEPQWAQLPLSGVRWPGVAIAYVLMAIAGALAMRASARRAGVNARHRRQSRRRLRSLAVVLVAALLVLGLAAVAGGGAPAESESDSRALRITMLDVGQGDAILLDPPRSEPVLVDGGPPGANLGDQLDRRGADALAAVVLTHDQLDHYGGLLELVGERPVGALLDADPARSVEADAAAAGVPLTRVFRGDRLSFAGLQLEVLWPPSEGLSESTTSEGMSPPDPNLRSLVLLARWHGFSLLLTGDTEAEAAAYRPGGIDLLKVAHHGSADAGLPSLLSETDPGLALISVGEENPYGHPAPSTLEALAQHSVPAMRTDLNGEIEILVGPDGWTATPEVR